jgi:hypothetical protein
MLHQLSPSHRRPTGNQMIRMITLPHMVQGESASLPLLD